jgi:hypothetical protein
MLPGFVSGVRVKGDNSICLLRKVAVFLIFPEQVINTRLKKGSISLKSKLYYDAKNLYSISDSSYLFGITAGSLRTESE